MSVKEITTGQDSFLDIVANLVGVLIILVVVVGAQAKSAWEQTEPAPDLTEEISQLSEDISRSHDVARKLEIDNHLIEQSILEESSVATGLSEVRHQMLVQIQIVERQIKKQKLDRRKKLDADQQVKLAKYEEQKGLSIQLTSIQSEAKAVKAAQPKSEVIEHFPNPIAKTVFSDEVHFQLRHGKIAHVPLDSLVSRMKSEWKVKAEKLKQAKQTIETVGPIDNFRLQYELHSESTAQGRQAVRFERFTIFPAGPNVGFDVASELSGESAFQSFLQRHAPGKTTVSLWVYPDSYAEYNDVKSWLYEKGYQVACWPLDANKRISGGPNGLRTSAQ